MRAQRLFHLLLLLAAVTLVIFLFLQPRKAKEEAVRPAGPLRPGGGAAVLALERIGVGDTLRVVRDEGMWFLRSPIDDLASTRMIKELLRSLENLDPIRYLETDSLARYGLDPPRVRMTLDLYGGQRTEVLAGAYAPTSGGAYLTWPGLGGVVLATPQVMTRFMESDLFQWREREILPPVRAAIDSLWIQWPDHSARLRRHDHEVWTILEPARRDADGLSCERTVAAFWRFPYSEFIDDPAIARQAHLEDAPLATWIVFRAGRADTLLIGPRAIENQMVVQLKGRSPGLIRDELFLFMTGGIEALEARRALWAEPHQVVSLVLADESGGVLFHREGRAWYSRLLTAPDFDLLAAGLAPDGATGASHPAADPSLGGDLTNLLDLQTLRWLPALDDEVDPNGFPLSIHLWDLGQEHQWAAFAPSTEDGYWGVVSSRHPRRPMEIPAAVAEHWLRRLDRTRQQ